MPESLPAVMGTDMHLHRVMLNLISNSIKYRSITRDPHITISFKEDDDMLYLRISDNGMGMESDHLENIFMPFKRLHHHSTIAGTGLGLSICRKSLQMIGGAITAQSISDVGSSFNLVLIKATQQAVVESEPMESQALLSAEVS